METVAAGATIAATALALSSLGLDVTKGFWQRGQSVKMKRCISLYRAGSRKSYVVNLPQRWKDADAIQNFPKLFREGAEFKQFISGRSINLRDLVENYYHLIDPGSPVPPIVLQLSNGVIVMNGLPDYPISCLMVVLFAYLEGEYFFKVSDEEHALAIASPNDDSRVPWKLLDDLDPMDVPRYGLAAVDAWFALKMPDLFVMREGEQKIDFELSMTGINLLRRFKVSMSDEPADPSSGATHHRHYDFDLESLETLLKEGQVGNLSAQPLMKKRTSYEILGGMLGKQLTEEDPHIHAVEVVHLMQSYQKHFFEESMEIIVSKVSADNPALPCTYNFELGIDVESLVRADNGGLNYICKSDETVQFFGPKRSKVFLKEQFVRREMRGDESESRIVRDARRLCELLVETYNSPDIGNVLNYLVGPVTGWDTLSDEEACMLVKKGAKEIGQFIETKTGIAKILGKNGMCTAVRLKRTDTLNVDGIDLYFTDGGYLDIINFTGEKTEVNTKRLYHGNPNSNVHNIRSMKRPGYCYRNYVPYRNSFFGSSMLIDGTGKWQINKMGADGVLVLKKAVTSGKVG